jgi:hypothetical protein
MIRVQKNVKVFSKAIFIWLLIALFCVSALMVTQAKAEDTVIGIHEGDVFRYRIVNPWGGQPQIAPFTCIATVEVTSIVYPIITCRTTLNCQNGTFIQLLNDEYNGYEDISTMRIAWVGGLIFFPANISEGPYEFIPGTGAFVDVQTKKEHGRTVDCFSVFDVPNKAISIHFEWFQDTGVPTYVEYVSHECNGSITLLGKCDKAW